MKLRPSAAFALSLAAASTAVSTAWAQQAQPVQQSEQIEVVKVTAHRMAHDDMKPL